MNSVGGATLQYTAVLKNLMGLKPYKKAMYLTTGLWSKQCFAEASKHFTPGNLIEVANTAKSGYN